MYSTFIFFIQKFFFSIQNLFYAYLGIEGFGTILAGLWGSGNGTNTFGENVGAIGVTKVHSVNYIHRNTRINKNFQSYFFNILDCVSLTVPLDRKSSRNSMGCPNYDTPRCDQ